MLVVDRPREHNDVARAARRQRESSLRGGDVASGRSVARSRPISTRNRARCDSSVNLAPKRARSARRAAHLRATPRLTRARARTAPDASRATRRSARAARRAGTRRPRAPSTRTALRHPRAEAVAPRRAAIRRAAGASSTRHALSTSAASAGMRASRAARSARASAARAAFVRRRRIAMPATTSSCAVRDAGGRARDRARRASVRPRQCVR